MKSPQEYIPISNLNFSFIKTTKHTLHLLSELGIL